jgi:hypothetical protein
MPVSPVSPSQRHVNRITPWPVRTYKPVTYVDTPPVYDDRFRPVSSLPAMTFGGVASGTRLARPFGSPVDQRPWFERIPGGVAVADWWTGGQASQEQATRPIGTDTGGQSLAGDEARNVELYQHGARQGSPRTAWPWIAAGTLAVVGVGALAIRAGSRARRGR